MNKLDKVLAKIFHPSTSNEEASAGFIMARQLYKKALEENKDTMVQTNLFTPSSPITHTEEPQPLHSVITTTTTVDRLKIHIECATVVANSLNLSIQLGNVIRNEKYVSLSIRCYGLQTNINQFKSILDNFNTVDIKPEIPYMDTTIISTVLREIISSDKAKILFIIVLFIFFWNIL